MGSSDDRDHFDDYRDQTHVKHDILAAYLKPFFTIVGATNKNLLYIDGFAGRGTYTKAATGEVHDGSPLRALKLIAGDPANAAKVSTLFIESDNNLFRPMAAAVNEFAKANPSIRPPKTFSGKFADGVEQLLSGVEGRLAPTFVFVDPCGVSGTCFRTIEKIMKHKSSEAFIFFNIDGVRRTAGLPVVSDVLVELFGSQQRANDLCAAIRATDDPGKREHIILSSYRNALREGMGAAFTTPFRVESEDKQKTSHYLIHATNHPLGFKIMKEVMLKRGQSEDGLRALELAQASRSASYPLFDLRRERIKNEITKALATGPQRAGTFYGWVLRPEDLRSESEYREALVELEQEGKIEVLAKDGRTPKPATTRQIRKGKRSLGEDYIVRMRTPPAATKPQDFVLLNVELGINATDEDIIDQMRIMKRVREEARYNHVICTIRGFENDPRELFDVPAVREFCGRLVETGFISYLDFTTIFAEEKPPMLRAGWGAAEVLLCSENRLARLVVGTKELIEELKERYCASNERADARIGPFVTSKPD